MEKILKIIVAALAVGLVCLVVSEAFFNEDNKKHVHCGYIEDKYISNPYEYRSGKTVNIAAAELYLVIHFDSFGFSRQAISTQTYYKHKVGDRICLEISKWEIQRDN